MGWIKSLSTEKPYQEQLQDEIESLRAKVAELEAENSLLHEQVDLQIPKQAFDQLTQQLTDEQHKVKVLTDALESIEWEDWHFDLYGDSKPHCPSCRNEQKDNHEPDCQLSQALSTAEQAYAERIREALSELVDLVGDMISGEYTPDSFTLQPARQALALPHDITALQEYGANLVDRVIDSINSEYHRPLAHIPDKIRKGEF